MATEIEQFFPSCSGISLKFSPAAVARAAGVVTLGSVKAQHHTALRPSQAILQGMRLSAPLSINVPMGCPLQGFPLLMQAWHWGFLLPNACGSMHDWRCRCLARHTAMGLNWKRVTRQAITQIYGNGCTSTCTSSSSPSPGMRPSISKGMALANL